MADDAWKQAQTLWGKLRGHKEVEKAAQDVAAMPEDSDTQAALRLQLKKLLAENEALAEELARLLEQAQPSGSAVTAVGARSIAVGGSVSSSTFITGDGNVVGDHSRSRVVKK